MVSNDPPGPRSGPTGEPGLNEDALSRLEERLERASEAAERLLSDATQRASRKPPPAGWQQPAAEDDGPRRNPGAGGDIDLLLGLLHSLGELIPSELQRRLADALREVLLALRALIDWYLERSELRRAEPVEVQDIPIV
jgi:hypothetical protein